MTDVGKEADVVFQRIADHYLMDPRHADITMSIDFLEHIMTLVEMELEGLRESARLANENEETD